MVVPDVPPSQRVIQLDDDGHVRLVDGATIPILPPGFVLIRTMAVALNPSDNKIATKFPIPGARIGTDFCGTVVQIAGDGGGLKVGDVVCGAAFCFAAQHRLVNGAFSEYVRAPTGLLLRLPPASLKWPVGSEQRRVTMSPVEAATLGTAVATCIMAFWSPDALGLSGTPRDPLRSESATHVLVYGGSTATGTIAIQLLRMSGYTPIALCSPHNFDLARQRGAFTVLDYAAPDVVEGIKAHSGGRLKYTLDCISDEASIATCYQAIQRPGGRYASLEHVPASQLAKRKAIAAKFVLAAEMFGQDIELGSEVYDRAGSSDKLGLGLRYMPVIQQLLNDGKLQAHPSVVLENGLDAIIGGMQTLAAGKVSGKKLVAVIESRPDVACNDGC